MPQAVSSLVPTLALLAALAAAGAAHAADAPPPAAATAAPDRGGDPSIQRIVIEDEQVRVEELRVRGQAERIVVNPKSGARPYEIVTSPHGRDTGSQADGRRGAAGQRVWNVLGF